jgi:hypothetical protein
MIISKRSGKHKARVEVDWNKQDPYHLTNWCKQTFKSKTWFAKYIRNNDFNYTFYYYFVNPKDATMFILRWSP